MVGIVKMERREDSRPWGLIIVCLLAAAVGVIGLPLQYATYNLAGTASKDDLERNRRVVERLAALEAKAAANVEDHRHATDGAHAEICRIIESIADAREIAIKPCNFERLDRPKPTPAPAPSPGGG